MAKAYFVEVTDTFAGEANYSWVRRYRVSATTERGAIRKTPCPGAGWRMDYSTGDLTRYTATKAAACAFVEWFDEDKHAQYTVEAL